MARNRASSFSDRTVGRREENQELRTNLIGFEVWGASLSDEAQASAVQNACTAQRFQRDSEAPILEALLQNNCRCMITTGGAMQPVTARNNLTEYDVSSILNLICPSCGGSLGGPTNEFKCQGLCRKDWRPDWESSDLNPRRNKTTRSKRRRILEPIQ